MTYRFVAGLTEYGRQMWGRTNLGVLLRNGWLPAFVIITGNIFLGGFGISDQPKVYPFSAWSLFAGFPAPQRIDYVAMVSVNGSSVPVLDDNFLRTNSFHNKWAFEDLVRQIGEARGGIADPATIAKAEGLLSPTLDSFSLYRLSSNILDEYSTRAKKLQFVGTFSR